MRGRLAISTSRLGWRGPHHVNSVRFRAGRVRYALAETDQISELACGVLAIYLQRSD